ncbi:MAG: DUF1460 domain-containing protein [Candidatus Marinimicrobia bacterium]|nr:DUF1460 domain-containing protein [Candidatus Neomarinimicrobiota bacterium]
MWAKPRRLKHITINLVTTAFLLAGCGKAVDNDSWLSSLPKPWQLSTAEIEQLLPEFMRRYPELDDRLIAIAGWRVGTPYEIFKLGEEVEPDPDPIIRLDVSDCTGHVLTSLSLAQSESWQQAWDNMIEIHYKADDEGRKKPTYASRWHYTTDRILSNPYTVDITRTLLPEDQLTPVALTLNRKESGEEFLDLSWSRPVQTWYIPNENIDRDLLAKLPAICGVGFVKPAWFSQGLIIGHEGMIVRRKDLIHASQTAGETERVDFLDYYFSGGEPNFGGIMIYAFRPIE